MTRVLVPSIACGVFVVYLAASALPSRDRASSGFDLTAFGRLPVSANGRVQPFESVARTALLQIGGAAATDPTGWLLEVLAKPDAADARRIFTIGERELVDKLQLPAASDGTRRYAFDDLGPRASQIRELLRQVDGTKPSDRAPWQVELLALRDRLALYERLKNSVQPNTRLQQDAKGKPFAFDFAAELARYQGDLAEALRVDAGRRRGSAERLDVATEMRLRTFAALFQVVSRTGLLAVVPPSTTDRSGRWSNLGSVVVESARGRQPPPAVGFFAAMASAFAQGKPDAFNSGVARYRDWLAANGLVPVAMVEAKGRRP